MCACVCAYVMLFLCVLCSLFMMVFILLYADATRPDPRVRALNDAKAVEEEKKN